MMVTPPQAKHALQDVRTSRHLQAGAAETVPSAGNVLSASRLGAGCARVAGRCLVGVAAAMVPHRQQAALVC